MTDASGGPMLEELIGRANRMGGAEPASSGFARLADSTVERERALAVMTRGQARQARAFLSGLVQRTTSVPAALLVSWLEAANRWLESMLLLHWFWQARVSRLLPHLLAACPAQTRDKTSAALLEAQRHTWAASAALAEALLQLAAYWINRLQLPAHAHALDKVDKLEKETLLMLDSVEEVLCLLLRRQASLRGQNEEPLAAAVHIPVREASAALLAAVNRMDGQATPLPSLSPAFIDRLKETVKRLVAACRPAKNGSPVFRAEPPFPKPWLNEEVFGAVPRERKKK